MIVYCQETVWNPNSYHKLKRKPSLYQTYYIAILVLEIAAYYATKMLIAFAILLIQTVVNCMHREPR